MDNNSNYSAKMKTCMKAHPMWHSLAGLGVGLLLVNYTDFFSTNAKMLGFVALVVAIVGDYFTKER